MRLSEQQLVDCTRDVNAGCSGGYLEQTFPYIEENGLESEENYAYTGKKYDFFIFLNKSEIFQRYLF